MDFVLGEQATEWVGYVVLRYYLTSASTSNEELGEMCLHGTGICSQEYCLFL